MIKANYPMKKLYIIVALCFVSSITWGQTKRAYIKAAEKAVTEENHYAALKFYSEALDFDQNDPEIIYQVAEAARKFNAYDLAAEKYAMLTDSLVADSLYPLASYHLGEMKQRMGDYESALQYYNMYVTEYSGTDSLYELKANEAIANTEWAVERMNNPDRSAEITQLESDVNSPYSDFGASMKGDDMYFTSMQHEEQSGENFPPRNISKLHLLSGDTSVVIDDNINNTDSLVAHTSFNADESMMYYTLCEFVTADEIRCDIYRRTVLAEGEFGEAEKLSSAVNIDSFTNTQPHVVFDESRQQEVLYFVSDRPGGKGELDIYYSLINSDGDFSEAKNLESINTEGNDVTPYINKDKGLMYFSSDARQGLGGYDIYKANIEGGDFTNIEGLRPPVNSSYHDLYYTVDALEEFGLFSSNREGAAYVDPSQKACCFDIYEVEYDEVIIDLDALTFDALTKNPLFEATVHLVNAETGDTIKTVYSEADSSHVFKLKKGIEYLLIAEREHYNTATVPLSTVDITKSEELKERIYMTTDKMQLDLFTFNERTKEELAGVTVKITDVTDPDNPIYISTNDASNDYHVYLELGKKYKIEAGKFGFVTEVDYVDLTNVTVPGLIKKDMYLEVFDIEDYMPVTVYFENDQPNPRSKSTFSDKKYGELYGDYVLEKPTYIKKVARRMNANVKQEAEKDIAAFFEGDVAGGYETLKRFMRALKKELSLGRSLEIAIKGYASPVADNKYNLALGQRRVQSVKNEILAYEGGLFGPYVTSGQLILTDISYGEELADKSVSDKKGDILDSVYSVGASRERKVEIVSVTDQ